MLEIYIDEQLVDLGKQFSEINLVLKSSFLTDQSAFSFPFHIPNNENNRNIFNLKALNQVYNEQYRKEVSIRYNTVHIDGYVDIIDIINDDIELNFMGWEVEIFNKLKNEYITDIDESTAFTVLQLYNSGYTKNNIYTCVPIDISTDTNLENKYLAFPMDRAFLNYRGDAQEIFQGGFYIEFSPSIPAGSPVNNFVKRIHTQRAPFYFLTKVIDVLFDHLGINIAENFIADDNDYKDLFVYHPPKRSLGNNDSITFQYNLPSIKIIDFIKEIEKRLLVRFVLNPFKRFVKIVSVANTITDATVNDVTAKSTSIRTGLLKSKNYQLRQDLCGDKFLDDTVYPDKLISTDVDGAETEEIVVKSTSGKFEVLEEHYIKTVNGAPINWYFRDFNCMSIGIDRDSPEAQRWDSHNFRLMFWNVEEETYRCYYTSDDTGPHNATEQDIPVATYIKGNRSLKWEDSGKGIYDTEYSKILFWKNNLAKSVVAEIKFNSSDLVDFDFMQKLRIDNVEFLVEEIPVEIGKNTFKTGKIKGITT